MDLARKEAYTIIYRVLKDHLHSDRLLEQRIKKITNHNDRSFLYHLVKGTIKMQRNLQYIAAGLAVSGAKEGSKGKDRFTATDLKIKVLLYLGLYQLIYCDTVPHHSAVDETVELAKKLYDPRVADFVNALLRAYLRNPLITYPDQIAKRLSYQYSFPLSLIEKWLEYWDEEAVEKLCDYFNRNPKLSIRINRLATNMKRLKNYFSRQGIILEPSEFSPNILTTDFGQAVLKDVSFEEGYYSIQDASSAMIVELLDPQEDENILDLFAGPGGKCTYMAELMNNTGEIVAVDKFPQKTKKIKQTVHRLQITNMKIIIEDALKFGPRAEAYDRVILDVPCTGWGILQKKAELRWQYHQDIKSLLKLQDNALETGAKFVKDGGFLVYSTCTMNDEENEKQVTRFLSKNKNFRLIDKPATIKAKFIENGFLKTYPHLDKFDGVFAAKMQKKGNK